MTDLRSGRALIEAAGRFPIVHDPCFGHLLDIRGEREAKLLKVLALPSEAHEFKDYNSLAPSLGKTDCIDLQGVSESLPKLVYQRDDGQYEVGLSGLIGPFPSRPFAEAIAREVLDEAS